MLASPLCHFWPIDSLNCDKIRQTNPICVAFMIKLRAHEGKTNRVGVSARDDGFFSVGVTTHTSTKMSHTKSGGINGTLGPEQNTSDETTKHKRGCEPTHPPGDACGEVFQILRITAMQESALQPDPTRDFVNQDLRSGMNLQVTTIESQKGRD